MPDALQFCDGNQDLGHRQPELGEAGDRGPLGWLPDPVIAELRRLNAQRALIDPACGLAARAELGRVLGAILCGQTVER